MSALDGLITGWWAWMWTASWQLAVLVAALLVVDRLIRRWAWPQVRLALWLAAALKMALPPTSTSPLSLTNNWTDVHAIPIVVEATAHATDALYGRPLLQTILSEGTGSARPSELSVSDWKRAAASVWLLGLAGLGIYYFRRFGVLRSELTRDDENLPVPDWMRAQALDAAREMGLRRVPPVLLNRDISSPAVFGFLKPIVLIPADWTVGQSRQDVYHALLHEMAHLRRGDLLVQGALTVLLMLFWFHPAAYMVTRRIGRVRELCCDATVAAVLKERTSEYRRTLLSVAQRVVSMPRKPLLRTVGLFERPGDLLARVRALHHQPWKRMGCRRAAAVAVGVVCVTSVLPMGRDLPRPCLHAPPAEPAEFHRPAVP